VAVKSCREAVDQHLGPSVHFAGDHGLIDEDPRHEYGEHTAVYEYRVRPGYLEVRSGWKYAPLDLGFATHDRPGIPSTFHCEVRMPLTPDGRPEPPEIIALEVLDTHEKGIVRTGRPLAPDFFHDDDEPLVPVIPPKGAPRQVEIHEAEEGEYYFHTYADFQGGFPTSAAAASAAKQKYPAAELYRKVWKDTLGRYVLVPY
jgi:hypothetical protein